MQFKIHSITHKDGTKYLGGLSGDNQPSHYGIKTEKSGKIISAEWRSGKIEGIAHIDYPDGREFIGKYLKNHKNGVGKITFGPKVYQGEFKKGMRTGYAELIELNDGQIFTRDLTIQEIYKHKGQIKHLKKGYFSNGKLEGYGEFFIPKKSYLFYGFFKQGYPNGQGIENTNRGRYKGNFQMGLRDGVGTYEGNRGTISSYSGYWLKGNKHNYGIEKFENGEIYEGFYYSSEKSGHGRLIQMNGDLFCGSFSQGVKHGFGKYETVDYVYMGNFEQDVRNGFGFSKKLGTYTYLGDWVDNLRTGRGYEVTSTDEYKGEFLNGRRHGKGVLKKKGQDALAYYFSNGQIIQKCEEDLSDLIKDFSKSKVDYFFESSLKKLEEIDLFLADAQARLEKDIIITNINFDQQSEELELKLKYIRREFEEVEGRFCRVHQSFVKAAARKKDVIRHNTPPKAVGADKGPGAKSGGDGGDDEPESVFMKVDNSKNPSGFKSKLKNWSKTEKGVNGKNGSEAPKKEEMEEKPPQNAASKYDEDDFSHKNMLKMNTITCFTSTIKDYYDEDFHQKILDEARGGLGGLKLGLGLAGEAGEDECMRVRKNVKKIEKLAKNRNNDSTLVDFSKESFGPAPELNAPKKGSSEASGGPIDELYESTVQNLKIGNFGQDKRKGSSSVSEGTPEGLNYYRSILRNNQNLENVRYDSQTASIHIFEDEKSSGGQRPSAGLFVVESPSKHLKKGSGGLNDDSTFLMEKEASRADRAQIENWNKDSWHYWLSKNLQNGLNSLGNGQKSQELKNQNNHSSTEKRVDLVVFATEDSTSYQDVHTIHQNVASKKSIDTISQEFLRKEIRKKFQNSGLKMDTESSIEPSMAALTPTALERRLNSYSTDPRKITSFLVNSQDNYDQNYLSTLKAGQGAGRNPGNKEFSLDGKNLGLMAIHQNLLILGGEDGLVCFDVENKGSRLPVKANLDASVEEFKIWTPYKTKYSSKVTSLNIGFQSSGGVMKGSGCGQSLQNHSEKLQNGKIGQNDFYESESSCWLNQRTEGENSSFGGYSASANTENSSYLVCVGFSTKNLFIYDLKDLKVIDVLKVKRRQRSRMMSSQLSNRQNQRKYPKSCFSPSSSKKSFSRGPGSPSRSPSPSKHLKQSLELANPPETVGNCCLYIHQNIAAWNVHHDIYLADLITKQVKFMLDFFAVTEPSFTPICFNLNFDLQKVLGFSRGGQTGSVYYHYADETLKASQTTQVMHISSKFSVCQEIGLVEEFDGDSVLLAGSTQKIRNAKRPFLLLCEFGESLNPISGVIVDIPNSRTIKSLRLIRGDTFVSKSFKCIKNELGGGQSGQKSSKSAKNGIIGETQILGEEDEDGFGKLDAGLNCSTFEDFDYSESGERGLRARFEEMKSKTQFSQNRVHAQPEQRRRSARPSYVVAAANDWILIFRITLQKKLILAQKTHLGAPCNFRMLDGIQGGDQYLADAVEVHGTTLYFLFRELFFVRSYKIPEFLLTELGLGASQDSPKIINLDSRSWSDAFQHGFGASGATQKNSPEESKTATLSTLFVAVRDYLTSLSRSKTNRQSLGVIEPEILQRFQKRKTVKISSKRLLPGLKNPLKLTKLKHQYPPAKLRRLKFHHRFNDKMVAEVFADAGGVQNILKINQSITKTTFELVHFSCYPKFHLFFTVNKRGDLRAYNLDKDVVLTYYGFVKSNLIRNQICDIVATKNCSKLLIGVNLEQSGKKGTQCFLKIVDSKNGAHDHHFPHLIDQVNGFEVSFHQDVVFLVGKKEQFSVLTAFEFGLEMLYICDFMRVGESFEAIDRITGTNNLVLQTDKKVFILTYFEESFILEKEICINRSLGGSLDGDYRLLGMDLDRLDLYVTVEKSQGKSEVVNFCLPKSVVPYQFEELRGKEMAVKLENDVEFFGERIKGNMTVRQLDEVLGLRDLEEIRECFDHGLCDGMETIQDSEESLGKEESRKNEDFGFLNFEGKDPKRGRFGRPGGLDRVVEDPEMAGGGFKVMKVKGRAKIPKNGSAEKNCFSRDYVASEDPDEGNHGSGSSQGQGKSNKNRKNSPNGFPDPEGLLINQSTFFERNYPQPPLNSHRNGRKALHSGQKICHLSYHTYQTESASEASCLMSFNHQSHSEHTDTQKRHQSQNFHQKINKNSKLENSQKKMIFGHESVNSSSEQHLYPSKTTTTDQATPETPKIKPSFSELSIQKTGEKTVASSSKQSSKHAGSLLGHNRGSRCTNAFLMPDEFVESKELTDIRALASSSNQLTLQSRSELDESNWNTLDEKSRLLWNSRKSSNGPQNRQFGASSEHEGTEGGCKNINLMVMTHSRRSSLPKFIDQIFTSKSSCCLQEQSELSKIVQQSMKEDLNTTINPTNLGRAWGSIKEEEPEETYQNYFRDSLGGYDEFTPVKKIEVHQRTPSKHQERCLFENSSQASNTGPSMADIRFINSKASINTHTGSLGQDKGPGGASGAGNGFKGLRGFESIPEEAKSLCKTEKPSRVRKTVSRKKFESCEQNRRLRNVVSHATLKKEVSGGLAKNWERGQKRRERSRGGSLLVIEHHSDSSNGSSVGGKSENRGDSGQGGGGKGNDVLVNRRLASGRVVGFGFEKRVGKAKGGAGRGKSSKKRAKNRGENFEEKLGFEGKNDGCGGDGGKDAKRGTRKGGRRDFEGGFESKNFSVKSPKNRVFEKKKEAQGKRGGESVLDQFKIAKNSGCNFKKGKIPVTIDLVQNRENGVENAQKSSSKRTGSLKWWSEYEIEVIRPNIKPSEHYPTHASKPPREASGYSKIRVGRQGGRVYLITSTQKHLIICENPQKDTHPYITEKRRIVSSTPEMSQIEAKLSPRKHQNSKKKNKMAKNLQKVKIQKSRVFQSMATKLSKEPVYNVITGPKEACLIFPVKTSSVVLLEGEKAVKRFKANSSSPSICASIQSSTRKSDLYEDSIQSEIFGHLAQGPKVGESGGLGVSFAPQGHHGGDILLPESQEMEYLADSAENQILWLNAYEGVRYVNFNWRDQAMHPTPLMKIWGGLKSQKTSKIENFKNAKNEKNLEENWASFVILCLLEVKEQNAIIAVTAETSRKSNLQKLHFYDIVTRQADFIEFSSKNWLRGFEVSSLINLRCGEWLLLAGSEKNVNKNNSKNLVKKSAVLRVLEPIHNPLGQTSKLNDVRLLGELELPEYEKVAKVVSLDEYHFWALAGRDVLLLKFKHGVFTRLQTCRDVADAQISDGVFNGDSLYFVERLEKEDLEEAVTGDGRVCCFKRLKFDLLGGLEG